MILTHSGTTCAGPINSCDRIKSCSKCAASFTCGFGADGCWCDDLTVSTSTLKALRAEFANCLCQSCLIQYANQVDTHEGSYFCSWSGGKDSSIALHRAIKKSGLPGTLLTMMIEAGDRSRSHGIPSFVLEEQARCLGVPIRFKATSWTDYEESFLRELRALKELGFERGLFGDIDLEHHREWVERVCAAEIVQPWLPLWQTSRVDLLKELLEAGYRAEIVAIKDGALPREFLGRVLDADMIAEFRGFGIDLCGEKGEYHTLVTNGPIFSRPLEILHERQVLRDGYWFSDVSLRRKE